MTVRPRRSVLYMPGSNARAIEKARELPADGIILDLEDAVAPEAKATAREQIRKALEKGGFGDREVLVRINGLDTRWWVDDLHAVADGRPDAVLVPKISDPHQLQDLAARMVDMGTDPHIRVWAMMETPLAMINVGAIAAAALDPETRLSGFVMGTNDLAKDTRARIVPGRAPMLPWLMTCVAAARAFGIDILDGVYNDLGNAEGFARGMRAGARSRLRRQDAHSSEADRALQRRVFAGARGGGGARKIIAAFDLPENQGKGVMQIDGRMVERLHADMARRTVEIADAIARRQTIENADAPKAAHS